MKDTFNIKRDRYAYVDYYSEESSVDLSCDGDADDDSFVSATERVRIDLSFLELSPTVERTRHNFNQLMRVCSDDDSSTMSCDLLSIATAKGNLNDDDLSYGSAVENLPSLSSGTLTEKCRGRGKYDWRNLNKSSVSINYSLPREMLCEDYSQSPSVIEISTDTSTLCSNQDFSVRTNNSEKTFSTCSDDIDYSIDLVKNMKRRINSLRRFPSDLSTTHGSSDSKTTLNSSLGADDFDDDNLSSQYQIGQGKCGSICSSSVSPVMTKNERLIEIKSKLRNLENLKKKLPYQQGSTGYSDGLNRPEESAPVEDLVSPSNNEKQGCKKTQDRMKDIRVLRASLCSIEGSRMSLIGARGTDSVATAPAGKYIRSGKKRQQLPQQSPHQIQERSRSKKDLGTRLLSMEGCRMMSLRDARQDCHRTPSEDIKSTSMCSLEEGRRTSSQDVRNKMVMVSHCSRQLSMSSQLSNYSEEFVVSSQLSNPLQQIHDAMIMRNDKIAETILRISREVMLLIFVLALIYILYSSRRNVELDAIQAQAYQMRLFEKALVIAHQQKNIVGEAVLQERQPGPFRRFFLGA